MVFSSITFLGIFLPVAIISYYLIGGLLTRSITVKNIILLIVSLVFYAWGEPIYILLMLISIFFNYIVGKDIAFSREKGSNKRATALFVFAVIFNLAVLGFFKYFGFLIENINMIFHLNIRVPILPLPIGISFYTFQIMSYVIDLYRNKIKVQKNIISFALYISLFPQLIAGPIVKYKDIEVQLTKRKETLKKYSEGLARFTVGLAKKLILANTLGAIYTSIQNVGAKNLTLVGSWVGILCYTLQIYFDFSGYSDMAIGLGSMFGFTFLENFNYPYIANSVTDFWRRWHISLSTWFKEYLYIPLGGNRRKVPRVIFNLMVVWFLTGLWHGASWNFVLWGVFYGVILIFEKFVLGEKLEKIPKFIRHITTLIVVMIGWVFFSSNTLQDALYYIKSMFGAGAGLIDAQSKYLFTTNLIIIVIGIFCATPLYKKIQDQFSRKTVSRVKIIAYPLLLIICIIFMISETYNPFLYFRF